MEKKAKREKKLAEKRAKKQAKKGPINKLEDDKTIPLDTVITLDHLKQELEALQVLGKLV